jgi:hypothetical protein
MSEAKAKPRHNTSGFIFIWTRSELPTEISWPCLRPPRLSLYIFIFLLVQEVADHEIDLWYRFATYSGFGIFSSQLQNQSLEEVGKKEKKERLTLA